MNVLVISCHPDDAEIGCGGTLMRCAARGDEVTVCHLANGNMGHVLIEPEELRRIRTAEAERAGARLGVKRVINLDAGDLLVDSKNEALVKALIGVIREAKPDFIITHGPDDYMKDHVETGRLAFDASFSITIPHYAAGEALSYFPPIFYMDTLAGVNFQPEIYVDVSDAMEGKLEALNCHESQVKWMLEHDHIDFLDMVRTCGKYRGYQSGVRYAEGFKLCKVYPRMPVQRFLP